MGEWCLKFLKCESYEGHKTQMLSKLAESLGVWGEVNGGLDSRYRVLLS